MTAEAITRTTTGIRRNWYQITADVLTSKHYAMFFTTQNMLAALWNTIFLAVLSGAVCVVVVIFRVLLIPILAPWIKGAR